MLQKLFRRKTQTEILHKKYEKLMQEYNRLSSINRAQSDSKYAEAQKIGDEIERLKTQN